MQQLTEWIRELLLAGAAQAADAPQGTPRQSGWLDMLPMLAIMFFIFYFLILRPQKKKQKQHETMLASISRGDTVITAGGFFGRVCEVLDDSYIIELADGVKARILKSSISTRREAGEERIRTRKLKKRRRDRDGSPNGKQENPEAVSLEKTDDVRREEVERAPLRGSDEGVSYEENEALVTGDDFSEEDIEASAEETKEQKK